MVTFVIVMGADQDANTRTCTKQVFGGGGREMGVIFFRLEGEGALK